MPLVFNIERVKTNDGRKRWRRIPTYAVIGWRCVHESPERLEYRPGGHVLFWRLILTAICLIIMAGLYGTGVKRSSISPAGQSQQAQEIAEFQKESDEFYRRELGEKKWSELKGQAAKREFEREREEQRLRRRVDPIGAIGRFIYLSIMWLLGAVAVLAPVSCLWNRVIIEHQPPGRLSVSSFMLWPAHRSWLVTDFNRLVVTVREIIHRRGRREGYRWHARLDAIPIDITAEAPWAVEFAAYMQKDSPDENALLPKPVKTLVDWLENVTGLQMIGPTVIEYDRSFWGLKRSQRTARDRAPLHERPPKWKAKNG